MARYDPETLSILRAALEEAWSLLPEADKTSSTRKSVMAQRILKHAAEGVRIPGSFESRPSRTLFDCNLAPEFCADRIWRVHCGCLLAR